MNEQMTLEQAIATMAACAYKKDATGIVEAWDVIRTHLNAAKDEVVASGEVGRIVIEPDASNQWGKSARIWYAEGCMDLPVGNYPLYTHPSSPDVVRDTKSGLQPISTAPEKTVVVAAWVDEDGCTRYEFDFKEDGVWFEHNERYEHYLSCAPRDIPCTGPSEEAPYTHWIELPIIDATMAAREGK